MVLVEGPGNKGPEVHPVKGGVDKELQVAWRVRELSRLERPVEETWDEGQVEALPVTRSEGLSHDTCKELGRENTQ
jgi:hypothetical protein